MVDCFDLSSITLQRAPQMPLGINRLLVCGRRAWPQATRPRHLAANGFGITWPLGSLTRPLEAPRSSPGGSGFSDSCRCQPSWSHGAWPFLRVLVSHANIRIYSQTITLKKLLWVLHENLVNASVLGRENQCMIRHNLLGSLPMLWLLCCIWILNLDVCQNEVTNTRIL